MRIAVVGPVFPYRAGIAYCTTRTSEELAKTDDVKIISFKRQFPRRFYPGTSDIDESLRGRTPLHARFVLDVINPISWIREALYLRRLAPDVVIVTWWIWVWALPYLVLLALRGKTTRVLFDCHNISDKEPSRWKTWLTNLALRRADVLLIHADSEIQEARRRLGDSAPRIEKIFLPIHELGTEAPSREEARKRLDVKRPYVALFFGHVRPFKALDVALEAWAHVETDVLLIAAGEVWWNDDTKYRALREKLALGDRVRLDFRFIPDAELSTFFAAADVVIAPYRSEAQSGVALTAFHYGRPVIATTVGGFPEIITEGATGLLVPPENPKALAEAVDRFFASYDARRTEESVRREAAKYSWQEFGSRVRTIAAT